MVSKNKEVNNKDYGNIHWLNILVLFVVCEITTKKITQKLR